MAKTPQPTCNVPEFAVRRETISAFFDPPLARSTFHDLVNKGKIIPLKGIRGHYLLNESLRRLGLREVPNLPQPLVKRSHEEILRLAFSMIDPVAFPEPSWLLTDDVELTDAEHARLLAEAHHDAIMGLSCVEEKIAYLAGVLDALHLSKQEEGKNG